jgi:hypothetical protein
MTPEQEVILLQTVTKVGTKMDMLVSDDGSHGQVPELKAGHDKLATAQNEQAQQISYWKGAIAVVAFFLLVFGATFVLHLVGGK